METKKINFSDEEEELRKHGIDEYQRGNGTLVIHQPSPEEIYDEHYSDLNKSIGVVDVVNSEFKRGFKRKKKEDLIKDDEKNLAKRREHIDNVDKPKLEKSLPPVTDNEIDEMNQMAVNYFGAEVDGVTEGY